MKILAIGGKNLASLAEEFRLDFRTEPLRSAGLFAITGSTGSGKTTILDAMCIALYERSPRLESIKNGESIENYGNTGLNESDPKTILSKGAHEGYAEVEFLAVDGKEYRVRWSVSRANDSASGRFRKTAYDVFNLSDGTHERYGKREYTAIIPLLIGLTYEEFTRAVLLAQGNFAAFLKAGENEKAAILQKLTGTEIYSRISSLIYSRTIEAKREADLVDAQRNGIKLLSPEEIEALESRKAELEGLEKENIDELNILTAAKQWIERYVQLKNEYQAVLEAHETALQNVKQNLPLAERLSRIDSVQDIRDTYVQCTEAGRLAEENRKLLAALKEKMKSAEEVLLSTTEESAAVEKKAKALQKEYDDYKPKINSIIKTEEEISAHLLRIKEINALIVRAADESGRLSLSITENRNKVEENSNERENINQWFIDNKDYSNIIPHTAVITANIRYISDTRKQILLHKKVLAETEGMLAESEKEIAEARKRSEELAKTLSSEIAELRRRLVAGEPCPVCGSRTHETDLGNERTLAEKELEKAKEIARNSIERLEQSISNHKSECNKQQSIIETLTASVQNMRERNIALLGDVDGCEKNADSEAFAASLQSLAADWDKKNKRLAEIKEEISVAEKSIAFSTERVAALTLETKENQTQLSAINDSVKKNRERLTTLLGKWGSHEEAENHFAQAIADANKAFTVASEKKAACAATYNRTKGNVEEKENILEVQEKKYKELSAKIDRYISERNDGMDKDELAKLFSPENNVAEMRAALEKVKDDEVKSAATLNERKRNLDNHNNDKSRPAENVTMKEVVQSIEGLHSLRNSIAEEKNGINAALLKDKENSGIFSQYNEVYEKKVKIATDWSELNSIFGSANGDKLTRLTQGYTLDILLDVANTHLREFSGRYILSRISQESLGIKVIDMEMMSDSRSVHSLSGGETFLASLALSLALSSVSSNRMNIESLFIDEGFGALDSETLKEAIDVLEKLQSRGRKIGVISHLGDMLERIPTRIKVVKRGNGKSKINIE